MSSSNGNFVWYELHTTDAEAAEAFYRAVVGWSTRESGAPEQRYTVLSVGTAELGGLMVLPANACAAGARPGWIGYIGVDDVDAYAARLKQAGGVVHRAAEDIPGTGRFSVVADPQGASFVLFKGSVEQPPERPAPGAPGSAGWRELHAADWEQAFAFYSGMFGWQKAETVDMGPMGIYQLFAADAEPIGGMMTGTDAVPAPFWLYYFNVDDIDLAVTRVKENHGKVLQGPHQVPGTWIVQCLDPQGAMFALTGPRR